MLVWPGKKWTILDFSNTQENHSLVFKHDSVFGPAKAGIFVRVLETVEN